MVEKRGAVEEHRPTTNPHKALHETFEVILETTVQFPGPWMVLYATLHKDDGITLKHALQYVVYFTHSCSPKYNRHGNFAAYE